jgi:hypothetical protein
VELLSFQFSFSTLVRLALTGGLMYATWIGHNWGRLWLVVLSFGAVAALALLGVSTADRLGAGALVLFAGCGILYTTIGCMLLWSRDVRAYLDEDKFPLPPGADHDN